MDNRNNGNQANEAALFATIVKVVITVMFVFPLVHYTIYKEVPLEEGTTTDMQNNTINNASETNPSQTRRVIIRQPSCPRSYLQVILSELCDELYIKKEMCTPDDIHNSEKHKLPKIVARNNTGHEPRGTIVGYLAGGLLLTSLGAAIIELYKAKSQAPAKAKPPLNRKCSLADLTVLKHNRKELVRKDSILEVPEDENAAKQLGFRPPPLHRRCSFPVGPSNEFSSGFRRGIELSVRDSRRDSSESRRLSIIDASRRPSAEYWPSLVDGRRISVGNDHSERRHHWSRLLHRH